jgi:FkbM family methyltransferase
MQLGQGNNTQTFGGGVLDTPASAREDKDLTKGLIDLKDYASLGDKSDGQLIWYLQNVLRQIAIWDAKKEKDSMISSLISSMISKRQRKKVFVEFGARDGWYESNTWLLEDSFRFQGLLVEAGRDYIASLREQRKCVLNSRPGACVWAALQDKTNQTLYWDISDSTKVDLNEVHTYGAEKTPHPTKKDREVKSTTLNHLLHRFGVSRVDFLSADCEGCEASALDGLDFKKHPVDFLVVEHPVCSLQIKLSEMGYTAVPIPFSYDTMYFSSALLAKLPHPPDTTLACCPKGRDCTQAIIDDKVRVALQCVAAKDGDNGKAGSGALRIWKHGDVWPPVNVSVNVSVNVKANVKANVTAAHKPTSLRAIGRGR